MKILIVDDETLIRTSITCFLMDNGIHSGEIFQAGNATEMKTLLSQNQFSIVFVDICMPGLDGLSALDAYSSLQANAAFYIISGYSKFEYAQKALRLHVEDYLLKPITPGQITDIVALQQQNENKRLQQKQDALSSAVRSFFEHGEQNALSPKTAIVVFYGLTEREKYDQMLSFIDEKLKNYSGEICCHFQYAYLDFFVLESCYPSQEVKALLSPELVGTGSNALIQCAGDEQNVSSLGDLLTQAIRLVIKPLGKCYCYVSDAALDPVAQQLSCLYYAYIQNNFDEFNESAKRFCLTLNGQKGSLSAETQHLLLSIINHYFNVASFSAQRTDQLMQLLDLFSTRMQMMQILPSDGMQQVKMYLDEHFTDKVSVTMLSDLFGYTPNHISASFTKRFGVSLVQYLTQRRMSYAVSLLAKPEESVQTIADMCGYSDANYFTRIFTRCYQCSPSEYRRKHLQ